MPPANVLELLLRRRAAEEGVPVDESGAPLFLEDAARLAGTAGTIPATEAPQEAPPSAPNIFQRLRQQSEEARALREESRDDLQGVSATTSLILKGFMAQALRNDRDIIEEFEEERKKPGLAKNILARFMLGFFSSDPNLKSIRDVQLRRFLQKKDLQLAADERRRKSVETAMRLLGVQERATESVFAQDAASERQASQQRFRAEESNRPPPAFEQARTRLAEANATKAEADALRGPAGRKPGNAFQEGMAAFMRSAGREPTFEEVIKIQTRTAKAGSVTAARPSRVVDVVEFPDPQTGTKKILQVFDNGETKLFDTQVRELSKDEIEQIQNLDHAAALMRDTLAQIKAFDGKVNFGSKFLLPTKLLQAFGQVSPQEQSIIGSSGILVAREPGSALRSGSRWR